ncbi:MAG: TauD/TfdA family dioxygenase [Myxococcales bacterium]
MEPMQSVAPSVRDPRWTSSELTAQAYRVEVDAEEQSALAVAIAGERPWQALKRSDVPVSCRGLFRRIEGCLDQSAGFCVVSGLPFDGAEESSRRVAFLAGYGVGTPVYQDAQAGRMVDIRSTEAQLMDAGMYKPRSDGTHTRPYETRAAFRLHTDACDVAGLFCVQAAATGGTSSLVNALTVYDRVAQSRPDLLAVLEEPFYYAKPRKPGEPASYHGIPVFSWHQGYFKSHIVPDLIYFAQFVPEVPRLTNAQHEALDLLQKVASSPELKFELRLEPGQLLLLNNHVVWHGRDAYEDAPDTVRHLLRIWMATPTSRPLHPLHEAWFGDPRPGALRGGYLRERLHELAEKD